MSALTLIVFLASVAGFALWPVRTTNPSRTPTVTPLRWVWQWLRVLSCRVVSLSRRVAPRVVYGRGEEMPAARVDGRPVAPRAPNLRVPLPAPSGREHAGGALVTSNEGAAHHQPVRALKRVHPLVPPAAPAPADPKVQLEAWLRRELPDPTDRALRAHVIREAERVHKVSKRTAQRAVRRVAGGAR